MILRRFTANLRRQDWTAVAVELVIVVLGVFIGLQAQEWATARAEQQRADVLLQQLRRDLDIEKFTLKMMMDYQQVTLDYAKAAIKGLESPGSVDPETWVVSAYQASQILPTQSIRATFDEMKSTGAIDLIRNVKFRTMLINYYGYDWSQGSTIKGQAPYRELVRSALPYVVQKAINASCGDINETIDVVVVTRLPKTCHIDLTDADISSAAATLRATPGFLPALTYQLSLIETNIASLPIAQQQLADVIAMAAKAAP
ncbi:MAG: hypothetical protein JSR65_01730 [Proteobacteria bacterium]|nr:hypothetical protein [Pseudomonadota bacterium]